MKSILITGGAGFVGSNLALFLKRHLDSSVNIRAFDNLKRRGSELNLTRLRSNGVEFIHGDVREPADLLSLPEIDLIIECSAEPSVLAGRDGSVDYLVRTNLLGTYHCLELARKYSSAVIFLSTSRVYPHSVINSFSYDEQRTRFTLSPAVSIDGVSQNGIRENLDLDAPRTLYGTTKLCSEHLIHEYRDMFGLRAVINRCGVITGPWQMGKVDQGFVVLWIAHHVFKKELTYIGFNGTGKQVRDILHIDDLAALILHQIDHIETLSGSLFNVGGGTAGSVSLCELTALCRETTGNTVTVRPVRENRPGDIAWYITDNTRVTGACGWRPQKTPDRIVADIHSWIRDNERDLHPIFNPRERKKWQSYS